MKHPKTYRNLTALAFVVFSCTATAENDKSVSDFIDTGTTLVAAATSLGEPEGAGLIAVDIAASLPLHGGQLSFLVEMGTSLQSDSGYPIFPSADQEQLQVTEIHYDFITDSGEWSIGFIDSKGYIDTSDVANDDKTQFSNEVFVNNPTIGFPESSLGLSWQLPRKDERSGYSFLLAASQERGTFVAVEAWRAFMATTIHLGAWGNSANPLTQVSQYTSDKEHGLYTSIDGSLGMLKWNLRAGIANPGRDVSESFISIANEIPLAGNSLGIAVGRNMRKDNWSMRGSSEVRHLEIYYRYALSSGISVTPCIQFLNTIEFNDSLSAISAGVRFRLDI